MCDWEEFIFGCSCSYTKRKNYCHFARNDPNHQCFGVQVLKKVWGRARDLRQVQPEEQQDIVAIIPALRAGPQ